MAKEHQILKETLNKVVNNSKLDIGAKYFILKDFFRDIEAVYYSEINSELMKEEEGGVRDAESIQSDQLEELPERGDSAE